MAGRHPVDAGESAKLFDRKGFGCYKNYMPIYEYECSRCGHRFEMLQKVAEPPLQECVKCGGAVERLLSSPAIQFKGSGWYVTDYARKGQSGSSPQSSQSGASDSSSKASTSKKSRSEKSGPAPTASSTSKD
ncbi:MAG: FmdB family zinc ribbon protein [Acidobacteriota bacterium]